MTELTTTFDEQALGFKRFVNTIDLGAQGCFYVLMQKDDFLRHFASNTSILGITSDEEAALHWQETGVLPQGNFKTLDVPALDGSEAPEGALDRATTHYVLNALAVSGEVAGHVPIRLDQDTVGKIKEVLSELSPAPSCDPKIA